MTAPAYTAEQKLEAINRDGRLPPPRLCSARRGEGDEPEAIRRADRHLQSDPRRLREACGWRAADMSALTPHIRTLRALSLAFDETAEAMQRLDIEDPVAGGMLNVAAAFERAADILDATERDLESRLVANPPRSADA